jgi:hypothetical protein
VAGFIQLIEFEAPDIQAVQAMLQRFADEHPDVFTSTASTTTEDLDRPGTYVSIVEFPSYEIAMEQSNNPALSEFAGQLAQLMSGPPRFRNLDVRAEM